jgi:hypothetical protein
LEKNKKNFFSLDILLRLIDKKKIGLDDVRAEVS